MSRMDVVRGWEVREISRGGFLKDLSVTFMERSWPGREVAVGLLMGLGILGRMYCVVLVDGLVEYGISIQVPELGSCAGPRHGQPRAFVAASRASSGTSGRRMLPP